ncbi:hypothetical protein ACH4TU_31620 [Streptomyces physcomitrii]|uniref:hypothetical protein n=1 Tax=Streptomyces physcomitrii TaxID=2724184 RepID=UPI0011AB6FD6
MSRWNNEFRVAAPRAASVLVVRWLGLIAVLMWVLPVCVHAPGEPVLAVATVTEQGDDTTAASGARSAAVRGCPDPEHGPGDAYCRPSAGGAASTVAPVAVPSPPKGDPLGASEALAPPPRPAPDGLTLTPGIHQLRVQRI